MGGIVVGAEAPGLGAWALAAAAACALAVGRSLLRRVPAAVSPLLLCAALGTLSIQPWIQPHFSDDHPVHLVDTGLWRITGVVDARPLEFESRTRFVLRAERADNDREQRRVAGLLRVTLNGEMSTPVEQGDRIEIRSRIRPVRSFNNPGGFDARRWMGYQDLWCNAYADAAGLVVVEREAQVGFMGAVDRVRSAIARVIDQAGLGPEGSVLKALVMGDASGIPPDVRQAFTRTGTSHILADLRAAHFARGDGGLRALPLGPQPGALVAAARVDPQGGRAADARPGGGLRAGGRLFPLDPARPHHGRRVPDGLPGGARNRPQEQPGAGGAGHSRGPSAVSVFGFLSTVVRCGVRHRLRDGVPQRALPGAAPAGRPVGAHPALGRDVLRGVPLRDLGDAPDLPLLLQPGLHFGAARQLRRHPPDGVRLRGARPGRGSGGCGQRPGRRGVPRGQRRHPGLDDRVHPVDGRPAVRGREDGDPVVRRDRTLLRVDLGGIELVGARPGRRDGRRRRPARAWRWRSSRPVRSWGRRTSGTGCTSASGETTCG